MEQYGTSSGSPIVSGDPLPKAKKPVILWILIAVLLLAVAFAAGMALTKDDNKNAAPSLVLPAATVTISPDGFVPSTVKIKKGQEVRWINSDEHEHQVSADDTVLKDLGTGDALLKNESYTYPFDDTGEYP